MNGSTPTALIWDADGPPPPGSWTVLLWRALDSTDDERVLSLPRIVEDDAVALRAEYLAWVHDVGNSVVHGKRVIDHLQLRPGFSYWWMTGLSHMPNFYEASHIEDAVKCLAFDRIARGRAPFARVVAVTASERLAHVLQQYCVGRGIEFLRRGSRARRPAWSRPRHMLAPLLALLILARAVARWCTFSARERGWTRRANAGVCLFDMFIYLQPQALAAGEFESQYWTALPRLLRRCGTPSTWVHTYFPHADVNSLRRARQLIARFNGFRGTEVHGLIDGQLSLGGIGRSLIDYVRLARSLLRLRTIGRTGVSPSGFNFWPLVEEDWRESLSGRAAMRNCVWLAAYESALMKMPRQRAGIYILENQPWEMALLYAWRAAGHGQIIGVPHSTVRFWDLRYHYDHRCYRRMGANDLPMPDLVAVNGPVALQEYITAGYPASGVREVEALRYLHLTAPQGSPAAREGQRALRILVCGDNIPGSNARLMDTIVGADALLTRKATYTFKPHRAAPFNVAVYRSLEISVSTRTLPELLAECDLVVTGNVTSAAVDAYVAGRPVLSMRDGTRLNASPLRGIQGARSFVGTADLARQIEAVAELRVAPPTAAPFFCLDAGLPRWARLLELQAPDRPADRLEMGS